MTSEDLVLLESQDKIGIITLNRAPKRNALDGAMVQSLKEAFTELNDNTDTRVILFKANGDHFCAGADIAWMQKMAAATRETNAYDALQLSSLMWMIYTSSKPVIVLAQGATMGGGLGLLAACDIAIAADNATFCFSEAKIGLTPSVVSPFVIAAMGERLARYYFLTAEKFYAEQARAAGLVHKVVLLDKLEQHGLAQAEILLQNSPQAVSEAKNLIRQVAAETLSEDLTLKTAQHLAKMRASKDAAEGLKAFLEKRPAKWI